MADIDGFTWSIIIAVVVILGLIGLLCWAVGVASRKDTELRVELCAKFNYDQGDVRVFLERIGADAEDFGDSRGLRIQYERFRDGIDTEFMARAEAHKRASDAESAAASSAAMSAAALSVAASASVQAKSR